MAPFRARSMIASSMESETPASSAVTIKRPTSAAAFLVGATVVNDLSPHVCVPGYGYPRAFSKTLDMGA
jgi:hypothetical protein